MNGNRNEYAGGQCTDANSVSGAQKPRNCRYRTKLCRNFPLGTCRYGHNCSYLHISSTTTTSPAPLVSPIPTAARSSFYPSLSIPNAPVPSASAVFQQKTAPDAPTKAARPGPGTRTNPAPLSLPQTHDGRTRGSRRDRDQPHRRVPLPRAHTPAEEYNASECPDSHNSSFALGRNQDRAGISVARMWRHQDSESTSRSSEARCAPTQNADMDMDAAVRQFPPAPPGTPVSVASPEARWKDLGEATGAVERYRWTANGVLKWANASLNATGPRHSPSQSPPPPPQQEQISSTMARSSISQAPKLFKHRNAFFKTKPCRFYSEPGGCIKGDRCNFIHEHPGEGRNPSGLVAPAEAYAESEPSGAESVPDDLLSPLSPSTAGTSEHVSEHAEPKKNFYPVTWRVVGGGVMMSGKREVCQAFMAGQCSEGVDCRYAHPEPSEPEYLVAYPEPPPMYSPISPMVSPVYYPYPYVYPTISPPQPFALPAMPGPMRSVGPLPAAAIPHTQDEVTQNGHTHTVLPSLMCSPDAQPSGLPYPAYSAHRVVDGSTLVDQTQQSYLYPEGGLYAETLFAARSMVRPVSTPPNDFHGPHRGAGVAQLFAAEMP